MEAHAAVSYTHLDVYKRQAVKSLKGGMPLVIYPEGGRTPDGEIKPFLPGAFFLAIKAQVDIVPVEMCIRDRRWPGRFQVMAARPGWPEMVIDVAHNPAGAWALRSAPVSYTHLDVYKRQPLGRFVEPAVAEYIKKVGLYKGR